MRIWYSILRSERNKILLLCWTLFNVNLLTVTCFMVVCSASQQNVTSYGVTVEFFFVLFRVPTCLVFSWSNDLFAFSGILHSWDSWLHCPGGLHADGVQQALWLVVLRCYHVWDVNRYEIWLVTFFFMKLCKLCCFVYLSLYFTYCMTQGSV